MPFAISFHDLAAFHRAFCGACVERDAACDVFRDTAAETSIALARAMMDCGDEDGAAVWRQMGAPENLAMLRAYDKATGAERWRTDRPAEALRWAGVWSLTPYVLLGIALWLAVHASGVHAACSNSGTAPRPRSPASWTARWSMPATAPTSIRPRPCSTL